MDPNEAVTDPTLAEPMPTEEGGNPYAGLSPGELKATAADLQAQGDAELAKDTPDLQVLRDIERAFQQIIDAQYVIEQEVTDLEALKASIVELGSQVAAAALEPIAAPEPEAEVEVVEVEATEVEVVEVTEPEATEEIEEVEAVEAVQEVADTETSEPAENDDATSVAEGETEMEPTADAIGEAMSETDNTATAALPIVEKVKVGYRAAMNSADREFGSPIDARGFGQAGASVMPTGARNIVAATVIASLPGYEDFSHVDGVEVLSNARGVSDNDRIIREAIESRSSGKVATAALCAPLEIIRDIPVCGTEATPFRDAFVKVPMSRGGWTYTPGVNPQAAIWTEADQAAVDPDDSATWKPCNTLTCTPTATVKADEVVGCISFDDTLEWSSPELVAQAWGRTRVDMVRKSEIGLMRRFDAEALAAGGAFTATNTATYASGPFLKESITEALNSILYTIRESGSDYVIALTDTFVRHLKANSSGQQFGDCTADVLACLSDLTGNEVVEVLDVSGAGADVAPASGVPGVVSAITVAADSFRVRLIPRSSMIVGVTGVEEYGVERSPELRRQNRGQMFGKEYFALARPGCAIPSYVDLLNVCVRGGKLGSIVPAC